MGTEELLPLRNLAEAIILQAAEDLWDYDYRKESIVFFCGEGYCKCAALAGMSLCQREQFLRMLKGLLRRQPEILWGLGGLTH